MGLHELTIMISDSMIRNQRPRSSWGKKHNLSPRGWAKIILSFGYLTASYRRGRLTKCTGEPLSKASAAGLGETVFAIA